MTIFARMIIAGSLAVSSYAQLPNFTPQTPLLGALLHNDSAEAKRLLESGADPNQGRFGGLPPVFLAIIRQDLALVRLMASKGADLTIRDSSGSTALMWAAFNENGDATLVEELLKRGADPLSVNEAGQTALTWALRRGQTPVVAALRQAGASNTAAIRDAVDKALSLLQKSGSQFVRVSGCFSCHHQALPQMAFDAARTRGLPVDEVAAREQTGLTVALLKSVSGQALRNRDRIPDPPISLSYALIGLAAEHYEPDESTDALAQVISAWQSEDGGFHMLPPVRPPLEASDLTATALSLRAIQLYGKHMGDRVVLAMNWLGAAEPRTQEDRAMQLLGLAWAKAPSADVAKSMRALLAEQRQDGGWAQLATLETDAYATGQALVALHEAGHAVFEPAYQSGIAFLLRTQFPDGSWLVRSRTFPVQLLKDSGFPHEKNQWISAAGTSWAAMALSLSLPPRPPAEAKLR